MIYLPHPLPDRFPWPPCALLIAAAAAFLWTAILLPLN